MGLALVTGASSGIGFEIAKQFAEHGYDLVVAAEGDGIHTKAATLSGPGTAARGELGETVGALTTKLDRKKAAVKPPLAIVASVAGVSVVGIVWWRKRSGRHRG